MKNYIIKPLISKPGIQRDGTPYASQSYIDGQWCRFYMGRPRKIGGYKLIDSGNTEIIRSLYAVSKPSSVDVYMGRASSVVYNNFDFNGNGSGEIDRTPTAYVPDDNNIWDFDLFTTTSSSTSSIVASVIPNADDNSNTTKGYVYQGSTNSTVPLSIINLDNNESTPLQVSGGVVFSSPVMVAYGNNGTMYWSNLGDVTTWDSEDNLVIASDKIVQAYRTRGSSQPQILCWTLSTLSLVTYGGAISDSITRGSFSSVTIQDDITIMSPRSVVQYNQQYYWIGIDQFYVYNGIVQRLENSMSSDWFFNNINLTMRSKVWGMVIPRYKEIWWFYPSGSAAECNAVVIYNVELNVWYDSVLSRAAGLSPSIFPLPLMSDSSNTIPYARGVTNTYPLWEHEQGNDLVIGGNSFAINSYFETSITTLFESDPSNNRLVRSRRIEPDFYISNNDAGEPTNMTVTVNNRMFPQDSLENGNLTQVGPISFNGNTRKIDDVSSQGRLVSFVFQSNEVGGYYQMGQPLLDYEVGDINP